MSETTSKGGIMRGLLALLGGRTPRTASSKKDHDAGLGRFRLAVPGTAFVEIGPAYPQDGLRWAVYARDESEVGGELLPLMCAWGRAVRVLKDDAGRSAFVFLGDSRVEVEASEVERLDAHVCSLRWWKPPIAQESQCNEPS